MARETKTVIKSDISGEDVPEDKAVTVTIAYADPRRNKRELDAHESEVASWAAKGREIKRRGRMPGAAKKS